MICALILIIIQSTVVNTYKIYSIYLLLLLGGISFLERGFNHASNTYMWIPPWKISINIVNK